jgi:hypothetical protein
MTTTPFIRQYHWLNTQRVEDSYSIYSNLHQVNAQVRKKGLEIGQATDKIEDLPVGRYLKIRCDPVQAILN